MADSDHNLERLINYYRPRVRERAEKLRSAGGRLSHHTVWFPLVDAYEPADDEDVVGREDHKKAALKVFTTWCEDTGVKPASVAGEIGHNLLLLVRGLSFLGMGLTGIGAVINVFKGEMGGASLLILAMLVLGAVWLVSSWLHKSYFDRVFAKTENVDGGESFEDKQF